MKRILIIAALIASPSFAKAESPVQFFLNEAARHAPAHKSGKLNPKFMTNVARAEGRAVRASYYGGGERLNRHTANGEVFRPGGLTAAHRTLPIGTHVRVCYRGCVVVRINDRGPAAWTGREFDLSKGAARAVGMVRAGVAVVRVARL